MWVLDGGHSSPFLAVYNVSLTSTDSVQPLNPLRHQTMILLVYRDVRHLQPFLFYRALSIYLCSLVADIVLSIGLFSCSNSCKRQEFLYIGVATGQWRRYL